MNAVTSISIDRLENTTSCPLTERAYVPSVAGNQTVFAIKPEVHCLFQCCSKTASETLRRPHCNHCRHSKLEKIHFDTVSPKMSEVLSFCSKNTKKQKFFVLFFISTKKYKISTRTEQKQQSLLTSQHFDGGHYHNSTYVQNIPLTLCCGKVNSGKQQ